MRLFKSVCSRFVVKINFAFKSVAIRGTLEYNFMLKMVNLLHFVLFYGADFFKGFNSNQQAKDFVVITPQSSRHR